MFTNYRPWARTAWRPGFTLVELLMVIVIIGLLMALLLPAIWAAQTSARQAQITMEIGQVGMKMEEYNSVYTSYPPSYLGESIGSYTTYGNEVVARHFRKRFPRMGAANWGAVNSAVDSATDSLTAASGGLSISTISGAEAMVFWLGGFASSGQMTGFNKNPLTPLALGGQREGALFEFDNLRLRDVDNDGWPEYYPPDTNFRAPYLYFAATPGNSYVDVFDPSLNSVTQASGVAHPYRTISGGFVNPKSFQIIWSGLDFDYGNNNTNKVFPEGNNYGPGDLDNLTNFAKGTLEDSIP